MAYKFQLGDAIMSGALAQEGTFEVLPAIFVANIILDLS